MGRLGQLLGGYIYDLHGRCGASSSSSNRPHNTLIVCEAVLRGGDQFIRSVLSLGDEFLQVLNYQCGHAGVLVEGHLSKLVVETWQYEAVQVLLVLSRSLVCQCVPSL